MKCLICYATSFHDLNLEMLKLALEYEPEPILISLNMNLESCMNFEMQCLVYNPYQITNELVHKKISFVSNNKFQYTSWYNP